MLSDLSRIVADVWSGVEIAGFSKVSSSAIQIRQARHRLVLLSKDWVKIPPLIGVIFLHILQSTVIHVSRIDETHRSGMVALRINFRKHRRHAATANNAQVTFANIVSHDAGRLVLFAHHFDCFLGTFQIELVVLVLILRSGTLRLGCARHCLLPSDSWRQPVVD